LRARRGHHLERDRLAELTDGVAKSVAEWEASDALVADYCSAWKGWSLPHTLPRMSDAEPERTVKQQTSTLGPFFCPWDRFGRYRVLGTPRPVKTLR